jgi:hypothetical protein
MRELPSAQGCDLGGAAAIESGLERRFNKPLRPKSQYPDNLRRQRQIEHICRTPRLVAELLAEIGRHHGIADDIAARIAAYAAIDPDVLAAVGGDRFPPAPLRVVAGGAP